MSFKSRELRGMFSALGMLCASLMLAACAAASYAGIPFAAGAADPELQALARRAESGDRQAQLELGIRFEEGRGVPLDLGRARDLYFAAATRERSGERVFLPHPRARGGGVSRSLSPRREFSGNVEAVRRWARVSASLAAANAIGDGSAQRVSPDTPPTESDLPPVEPLELQAAAYRDLVELHGYQPIFNGLKHREGPWEERIVTEPAGRFFTDRSLHDSFLFIIAPPAVGEAGRSVGPDEIRAFCATRFGRAGVSSVQRRAAGLCALHTCAATPRAEWDALARSVDLRAGDDQPIAHRQIRAQDAAFLLRVAMHCGRVDAARRLADRLIEFGDFFSALRERCGRRSCAGEEALAVRQSLAFDAQLLLAVAEGDAVPADLASASARRWIQARPPATGSRAGTDPLVDELCRSAIVHSADCRPTFPHSYFLERHYLAAISAWLANGRNPTDPCPAIRQFQVRFEREIEFRFSALRGAGERLKFARRCYRSRDDTA